MIPLSLNACLPVGRGEGRVRVAGKE